MKVKALLSNDLQGAASKKANNGNALSRLSSVSHATCEAGEGLGRDAACLGDSAVTYQLFFMSSFLEHQGHDHP